jgi:hypothetical protein
VTSADEVFGTRSVGLRADPGTQQRRLANQLAEVRCETCSTDWTTVGSSSLSPRGRSSALQVPN